MKYEYMIEKCRRSSTAQKILNQYAANGWRLVTMCMGDMATQFIMTFERPLEN